MGIKKGLMAMTSRCTLKHILWKTHLNKRYIKWTCNFNMDLPKKHTLVLRLLEVFGVLDGRTKLQKSVFLAQEQFGVSKLFTFQPLHYGPYSYDLNETVSTLVSLGLVTEEVVLSGSCKTYNYRITESGKKLLSGTNSKNDELANGLSSLHEFVCKFKNPQQLIAYVYNKFPTQSGISK